MTDIVTTPKFIVSFPSLFEQDKYGRYSIQMKFKKGEEEDKLLQPVRDLLDEAAKELFGSKIPKNIKRYGIEDGDTLEHESVHGFWLIKAKSQRRPKVVDQQNNEIDKDSSAFYAGCYARAKINAYAFDKGSPGVTYGLVAVQKMGDGKRIGGFSSEEAEFDAVEEIEDVPF